MTLLRLCAGCGRKCTPAELNRSRCPDCLKDYYKQRAIRRGNTNARGYGTEWRKLAAEAIRRQPFCSNCRSTTDLTVDHRDPATRGRRDLTLNDVDVLCRPCNSAKADGNLRPTSNPRPPHDDDDAPLLA